MVPEIPSLSTYARRRRGHIDTTPSRWSVVAARLTALQHLRADQLCFLLVLVVGALLLSVAPATLVLTVGFLAVTLGLLGLVPLLLTTVLDVV